MSEDARMAPLGGGGTIRQFQDSMRAIYGVGQNAGQRQRRLERLAAKQGGICLECQLPLPEDLTETEIDHIIPRARGGPNAAWNKRLAHLRCNRKKRATLTPEAVELAAKHGVRTHQIQPTWAHATRPLTRADAERADYWAALSRASSREEMERIMQERRARHAGPVAGDAENSRAGHDGSDTIRNRRRTVT